MRKAHSSDAEADLVVLQKGNELKESATSAEELINRALAVDPRNPLALHLHIHIAEAASPQRWQPDPPFELGFHARSCLCSACAAPPAHALQHLHAFAGTPLSCRDNSFRRMHLRSHAHRAVMWGCRGPHLNAARAEASAQAMLSNEGPWTHGFGHLQHMPSHTFVRLGQVGTTCCGAIKMVKSTC